MADVEMKTKSTEAAVDDIPFEKGQVKLAVAALHAHLNDRKTKKDQLFSANESMELVLGMKKVPVAAKKPQKIPLPHNYNGSSDVCLITKDPGKVVKGKLEEAGVTSITKVISLTKLRKEYKTYALKRELLASYDMFLCDDRVYHFAVKSLGKQFFKARKEPIPIRLTYKDWKTEISKSLNCTLLRISQGPCSTVKVGNIQEQSEKELCENAVHMMKIIGTKIPGAWDNVKSFHLKTTTSVSLPVYQSSPLVDMPMEMMAVGTKS